MRALISPRFKELGLTPSFGPFGIGPLPVAHELYSIGSSMPRLVEHSFHILVYRHKTFRETFFGIEGLILFLRSPFLVIRLSLESLSLSCGRFWKPFTFYCTSASVGSLCDHSANTVFFFGASCFQWFAIRQSILPGGSPWHC